MLTKYLIIGALALSLAGAGHAATVVDPVGDFLGGYIGPHDADLDVVSFSVGYDPTLQRFRIRSTMAGKINPLTSGFYVIGVNTGSAATPGPFAAIGQPNVIFNRVLVVQKSGAATISNVAVPDGATISRASFSVFVPLSMLASTGFAPTNYGFNIWPRSSTVSGTAVISDFAPENATAAAVPEPASWAMMLGGFGLLGTALRRRRIQVRFA